MALMIRTLAWWGTTALRSAEAMPAKARAFSEISAMPRTADLKTWLPSILMKCCRFWTVSAEAGRAEPPASTRMRFARLPSEPMAVETMPREAPSPASRTTAPAPSPKITHVPRSCQSRMALIFSAPTTRALRAAPVRMYWRAMSRA